MIFVDEAEKATTIVTKGTECTLNVNKRTCLCLFVITNSNEELNLSFHVKIDGVDRAKEGDM